MTLGHSHLRVELFNILFQFSILLDDLGELALHLPAVVLGFSEILECLLCLTVLEVDMNAHGSDLLRELLGVVLVLFLLRLDDLHVGVNGHLHLVLHLLEVLLQLLLVCLE